MHIMGNHVRLELIMPFCFCILWFRAIPPKNTNYAL